MTKTLTQIAMDSIVDRTEFALLEKYHKVFFKENLSMYYINFSLDTYNSYKHIGKLVALKYGLVDAIKEMGKDYNDQVKFRQKYFPD